MLHGHTQREDQTLVMQPAGEDLCLADSALREEPGWRYENSLQQSLVFLLPFRSVPVLTHGT